MNEEIPSWDWERLSPCALASLVCASCQCFLVPHSSLDDISRKGDFEIETVLQLKCLDIHFLRTKVAKRKKVYSISDQQMQQFCFTLKSKS